MKVMFDTNVFNHILDNEIHADRIPSGWKVHVTHIQRDEINQTPNKYNSRKKQLLAVFDKWIEVSLPTESAVWDVSTWDESKWPDEEDSLYEKILTDLNNLRERQNNIQDALIAETAIINDLILVTNDKNLKDVAELYGAQIEDLRMPTSK